MPGRLRGVCATLAVGACIAGCSHANYNPVPATAASPSSSGSPALTSSGGSTATPSPAPSTSAIGATVATSCGTPAPGALDIAMGSYIEPGASDPTYGVTYGYSLVGTDGNYPLTTTPIQVLPGDIIQFTNVDPTTALGGNGVSHSAAGFGTSSFAPTPHVFANAAYNGAGSNLSDATIWSTGEIPSEVSSLCYSQPLTVPASGAYYFGDLDFYNSVNMRGVIVISSSALR